MRKKKDYLKTNNSHEKQKVTTSNLKIKDEELNIDIENIYKTVDDNINITNNNLNTTTKNAQILDEKGFNGNIFSGEKNTDKSKLIMAKILKELRQNDEHLLQSVFQDFENAIIVENKLIVSFSGENYKEILEKTSNLTIINDIISSDGLIVEYKFETTKKEKTFEQVLKEKFNKINIKE